MRKWGIKLAYCLIFIGGAFFGLFTFNKVLMPIVVGRGRTTEIPDILGMTSVNADILLKYKSFNLRIIREEFSPDVPEGLIVKQIPKGGTLAKKGRTVRVIISKGGQVSVVPNISGLLLRQATIKIEQVGLTIGKIVEILCDTIDRGFIISTSPAQGETISQDETVNIVVSKGSSQQLIRVPNLVGMQLSNAFNALHSRGLIGIVVYRKVPTISPNEVFKQTPVPGTKVTIGACIRLIVNKEE